MQIYSSFLSVSVYFLFICFSVLCHSRTCLLTAWYYFVWWVCVPGEWKTETSYTWAKQNRICLLSKVRKGTNLLHFFLFLPSLYPNNKMKTPISWLYWALRGLRARDLHCLHQYNWNWNLPLVPLHVILYLIWERSKWQGVQFIGEEVFEDKA